MRSLAFIRSEYAVNFAVVDRVEQMLPKLTTNLSRAAPTEIGPLVERM
jgi:hypothetical protein